MISSLGYEHLKEIVKIHQQELKGDFLPSLGSDFLEMIYQGLLDKSQLVGFVFREKERVVGFVVGTVDMNKFFSTAIKANFLKLAWITAIKVLQKPVIIKKIAETFFYPEKDKGVKAELVVIAVLRKWHGTGIGKKLIKALEKKFKTLKIKRYKLTVYEDKKAIKFYERLNFIRKNNFNLYGKSWSIYEKKID